MLALRMIIFLGGIWLLVIVIGSLTTPFLPTNTLQKMYIITDSWLLRPLNNVVAWNVEVRQFRSHDN